jgi:hypothetical protein
LGEDWKDGLDPWQVELAEALDDMVSELGRIPTTDAAYTDFSPYLAQGMTCGNCIASGENGCDWVAISCVSNGWCKFNVVPALEAHSTAVGLLYKRGRDKKPKDLFATDGTDADTSEGGSGEEGSAETVEMAKMDGYGVTSGHVDGVGSFSGGKKKPKTKPKNMNVIESGAPEMVNPEVMQDANLLQKSEGEIVGAIRKSDEKRYTLAPWYVPNRMDAHNEWTDAEEIQKALWDYVENADRDIRLQHNVDIVAGKWVEAMTWPHEIEVPMLKADSGQIVKTTFPAGTTFLGVIWEPWAWDLVKKGKIRGFSIGGTGSGVNVDLPTEFDKPATFLGESN